MQEVKIFDVVPLQLCEAECIDETVQLIGLVFDDMDAENGTTYLSLACAKAMLVDLREAIDACVRRQAGKDAEDESVP